MVTYHIWTERKNYSSTWEIMSLHVHPHFQGLTSAQLEAVIGAHPHVADVAVIGIPEGGDTGNDLPRAYIVPSTTSLTPEEIHEYVNAKVADFKRLRGGVFFVDKIERVIAL
jgi:acyl-CoA synthetase (AMP-forming)/AMP-acid ligase II